MSQVRYMPGIISVCLLLVAGPIAASAAVGTLPDSLQAVINGHKLPEKSVSIVVQEIGATERLLSLNAAMPLNPASTIKLLTTWLALEELGPAYTWPTEAYLGGKLERGVLHGDLIIKGYGAEKGMIIDKNWDKIKAVKDELLNMGFGFSCLEIDESSPVEGFRELLDDWGKTSV